MPAAQSSPAVQLSPATQPANNTDTTAQNDPAETAGQVQEPAQGTPAQQAEKSPQDKPLSQAELRELENERRRKEIDNVVQAFVDTYITDDMGDFEREIQVVQYIAENVQYHKDPNSMDVDIAYGALVNGKAECDGIAHAFKLLAEAAVLEAEYIGGVELDHSTGKAEGHSWN